MCQQQLAKKSIQFGKVYKAFQEWDAELQSKKGKYPLLEIVPGKTGYKVLIQQPRIPTELIAKMANQGEALLDVHSEDVLRQCPWFDSLEINNVPPFESPRNSVHDGLIHTPVYIDDNTMIYECTRCGLKTAAFSLPEKPIWIESFRNTCLCGGRWKK
jgi:hypothetical protein